MGFRAVRAACVSRAGWLGREEGGRCVLGEGLVLVGSSPVLHPEFVHTSGCCAEVLFTLG